MLIISTALCKACSSSTGLVFTFQATNISPEAMGYPSVPGIWTMEQADSWKRVTDAVHAKGASIFCQLWHVGRVANSSFGEHPLLRGSSRPLPSVSSSASPLVHPRTGKPLKTITYQGIEDCETPRALLTEEIERLREDYRQAARNQTAQLLNTLLNLYLTHCSLLSS